LGSSVIINCPFMLFRAAIDTKVRSRIFFIIQGICY
jgi:hypothetical protein